MRLSIRTLIIALLGFGLTLIAVGMTPLLIARAQEATAEPTSAQPDPEAAATEEAALLEFDLPAQVNQPTGDNSYCSLCHNVPWRVKTLPDGTLLNLFVGEDIIQNSVHGATADHPVVGCVDCHTDQSFPHFLNPSVSDGRTFRLNAVTMCIGCHQEQAKELEFGRHAEAIRAGNKQAAVCIDCHGAHDVAPVAEHPGLVAAVCGDCHTTTLAEFQSSTHVDIGPLGCGSCHLPHSQEPRVGGDTPDALCLNCHKEMPETLVHEQHANEAYPLGCVDCHMNTEATDAQFVSTSTTDKPTGHSMHIETVACTTCHENLVASGEWAALVSDRGAVASQNAGQSTAGAAETTSAVGETASGETSNNIPLIQGLILGLGFGVTFAAVFLARGNRSIVPLEPVDETAEAGDDHDSHGSAHPGVKPTKPESSEGKS